MEVRATGTPETVQFAERKMDEYRQVVNPKLKANRDTMRQEILAEQKKLSAKKTATAIATGQVVRTKEKPDASSTDLDTRIKNGWKRKGLI